MILIIQYKKLTVKQIVLEMTKGEVLNGGISCKTYNVKNYKN